MAEQEATPSTSDVKKFEGGSQHPEEDEDGVSVATGLDAVQLAVDLMNSNRYRKAIRLLKPKADVCMYYSTGYGSVLFLQAVFCMEKEVIDKATKVLHGTVDICNSSRRSRGVLESLSSWMFGQRLDGYSREELQAEVLYAEANLLLSFLTFLQDESLMSFVKGGLRIRNCYSIYKQLYQWMMMCEEEGIAVEENFAAGVRMGYGYFNLFLSLLPTRILRLLEFIGFSGNRKVGLEELEKGAASPTFRAPLCTSLLLFYYTVAAVITGIQIDAEHAEKLLRPQLTKYPDSVQFLYFKGRVAAMQGNIDMAIEAFKTAMEIQDEWRQVRHLCWWELAWSYCLKSEWGEAAKYCDYLYKESKWSKATFLYMKASCIVMQKNLESSQVSPTTSMGTPPTAGTTSEQTPPVTDEELLEMMRKIPPLKQRIAGKSIPIEKFGVVKSERYIAGAMLPVCGMELLYSHNAFLLLRKNPELMEALLSQVRTQMQCVERSKDSNSCYSDDWCVVSFVQGAMLRVLGRHQEAETCFLGVIQRANELHYDTYTVPAASAELGLLYIEMGRIKEAEKRLEAARTNYKGYHLESRIHFRIHEGRNRILQLQQEQ